MAADASTFCRPSPCCQAKAKAAFGIFSRCHFVMRCLCHPPACSLPKPFYCTLNCPNGPSCSHLNAERMIKQATTSSKSCWMAYTEAKPDRAEQFTPSHSHGSNSMIVIARSTINDSRRFLAVTDCTAGSDNH